MTKDLIDYEFTESDFLSNDTIYGIQFLSGRRVECWLTEDMSPQQREERVRKFKELEVEEEGKRCRTKT